MVDWIIIATYFKIYENCVSQYDIVLNKNILCISVMHFSKDWKIYFDKKIQYAEIFWLMGCHMINDYSVL